ncbi:hypothetical protein BK140_17200 [Paenibacillus macerans]|nr:hypothetical protein BK140_17200 [Paenibacillus macerans]
MFECGKCKHQTSPLVSTIFEGTHLPLVKWFQALEPLRRVVREAWTKCFLLPSLSVSLLPDQLSAT